MELRGRKLFVTGISGFVGRRLLPRLADADFDLIRCLLRPGSPALDGQAAVETVTGRLEDPASYEDALLGCDRVLHLASTTGKVSARRHRQVIVEGTRGLVQAAQRQGIRDFLYVSSIAAGFPDRRFYAYGQAKLDAEAIVRESGLAFQIVRPALVAGPGSPALEGLARLAGLPFQPMFGGGRAMLQPIHVEDLADMIVALLLRPRLDGETLELGGCDRLEIRELVGALRRLRHGKPSRAVSLPIAPIRLLLGLLEPVLGRWLPITAGQLATFANDGVAAPSEFLISRMPELRPLKTLLEPGGQAGGSAPTPPGPDQGPSRRTPRETDRVD